MSLSVTYIFVNGNVADATEVNQNFDDVELFVNTTQVHDGTNGSQLIFSDCFSDATHDHSDASEGGSTIGGITVTNLVDKTSTESISGVWTHIDTLIMSASEVLRFRNSNTQIYSSVDGTLDITASTLLKLNGNVQLDSNLDMTSKGINNADYIEFQGSDYIIRVEDDADTGIYYDSINNEWKWVHNGVNNAKIDLDNGNFWTTGTVDTDGLKIGSSGTYTGIADNLADSDSASFPDSTLMKNLYVNAFSVEAKNHIRQLIDRAVDYSADQTDLWGEAYIDADGRNNSVDTGNTTATFDTDKYKTTGSSESLISHNIPSGTFSSTISSAIGSLIAEDWEDGADIQYKIKTESYTSNIDEPQETSEDLYAYYSTVYDFRQIVNALIEDLDFDFYSTNTQGCTVRGTFYYLDGTSDTVTSTTTSTSYVSGTLTNPNPSKRLLRILIDWKRDGAHGAITYMRNLTGTNTNTLSEDDSGWLNTNEVSTFTAFTSEPTTLIVKLIPKSSGATAGMPSVKGFTVKEIIE